jgi:ABC-type amino acid transport substrate-binding protein
MKRIWARGSDSNVTTGTASGEVKPPPRCFSLRLLWPLLIAGLLIMPLACRRPPQRLARIRSSGVLRVAIDPTFAPFATIDAHEQIVGFDADLAGEVARRLGAEAHLVTTGYDALYDALTVDRADVIISALYPDPHRSSAFAFSRPYFNAGQVLVVTDDATVRGTVDLVGRPVAVIFGTSGHMKALQLEAALEPMPTLVTAEDWIAAAALLAQGTAEAAIVDHVSARMLLHADPALSILAPALTEEPYTIAVRREDADLLEAIDEILRAMEREDEIATLVERWMRP